MKKILILGGSGFIGKNLLEKLIKNHYFVRIFDKNKVDEKKLNKNLEFQKGNFEDIEILKKSLKNIDIVIHLLSTTNPALSNNNPRLDIQSNLINTLNLLDLMCEVGVKRIIFASTGGAIYGDSLDSKINECHATNPISSYGVVKLAIEKYLEIYNRKSGIEYTVLRFGNPYGEYQNPHLGQGAIAAFVWKAINDIPIEIWGNGEVARDFIYISDVVNAIVNVVERQPRSRIYNIGSGEKITLNRIISLIKNTLPNKIEVIYCKSRDVDVVSNCLDINLAQDELNWHPEVSISEGILRLVNYYKSFK